MKVKKTLAILTLPFMCLLSSCKEEPLVYGTKCIFERPANYRGLYWLGDKVDINDKLLLDISTFCEQRVFSNYSRIFIETKFVQDTNDMINSYSQESLLSTNTTYPCILYKISKGYKKSEDEINYYITGVQIANMDIKPLFGVDYYSSSKDKIRKMAEYDFVRYTYTPLDPENYFVHYKYIIDLGFLRSTICFDARLRYDLPYSIANNYDGYDEEAFADDNRPGTFIGFLTDD